MDVRTTFLNGGLVEDVYMSLNLPSLWRLVRKTWFVSSIHSYILKMFNMQSCSFGKTLIVKGT